MKLADCERLINHIQADIERLATGRRADGTRGPTLIAILEALDEWSGVGYPTGGSGVRASSADPLPERIVIAADGRTIDQFAHERLEGETTLRVAADCLAYLNALVARHTPSRKNPDDRPTVACIDCGRTIADTPADPVKAGRCTSSKDEPEVGCLGKWERERKRKARQRGRDLAELVEGLTP